MNFFVLHDRYFNAWTMIFHSRHRNSRSLYFSFFPENYLLIKFYHRAYRHWVVSLAMMHLRPFSPLINTFPFICYGPSLYFASVTLSLLCKLWKFKIVKSWMMKQRCVRVKLQWNSYYNGSLALSQGLHFYCSIMARHHYLPSLHTNTHTYCRVATTH